MEGDCEDVFFPVSGNGRLRKFRDALKDLLQILTRNAFLWRVLDRKQSVFITFDDGPHPVLTPIVLDIMDRHNAKATFFVVGEKARAYPEIVNQIVNRGHDVGIHGMTHADCRTLDIDDLRREIEETGKVLEGLGIRTQLFRPPKGSIGIWRLLATIQWGYRVVFWTRSVKDYQCEDPLTIARGVADPLLHGILLLHDTHAPTVTALPMIMDHMRSRNMEMLPISALFPESQP